MFTLVSKGFNISEVIGWQSVSLRERCVSSPRPCTTPSSHAWNMSEPELKPIQPK